MKLIWHRRVMSTPFANGANHVLISEKECRHFIGTKGTVLHRLQPPRVTGHFQRFLHSCTKDGPHPHSGWISTWRKRKQQCKWSRAKCEGFFQSRSIVWKNPRIQSLWINHQRAHTSPSPRNWFVSKIVVFFYIVNGEGWGGTISAYHMT